MELTWKKIRSGEYATSTPIGSFKVTRRDAEWIEGGDEPGGVYHCRDWVILQLDGKDMQWWDTGYYTTPTMAQAKEQLQRSVNYTVGHWNSYGDADTFTDRMVEKHGEDFYDKWNRDEQQCYSYLRLLERD